MSNGVDVDLNISASEESKGGVKYELVLSQPVVDTPPKTLSPTNEKKSFVSAEMIQQKLKQAAERRQSLESEKLATLQEKLKKIDEAAKIRAEEESNFINSTKENLEKKLKVHIDNRENIITDLKVKLSNHNNSRLQEVRQNLESSVTELTEKVKEEVNKKLETAEQNRERVIQEKLESLKKHEEKIEQVKLKRSSSVPGGDNNMSMDGSSNGTSPTSTS